MRPALPDEVPEPQRSDDGHDLPALAELSQGGAAHELELEGLRHAQGHRVERPDGHDLPSVARHARRPLPAAPRRPPITATATATATAAATTTVGVAAAAADIDPAGHPDQFPPRGPPTREPAHLGAVGGAPLEVLAAPALRRGGGPDLGGESVDGAPARGEAPGHPHRLGGGGEGGPVSAPVPGRQRGQRDEGVPPVVGAVVPRRREQRVAVRRPVEQLDLRVPRQPRVHLDGEQRPPAGLAQVERPRDHLLLVVRVERRRELGGGGGGSGVRGPRRGEVVPIAVAVAAAAAATGVIARY